MIKDLFSVMQGCDLEKTNCQKISADYQHLTTRKNKNYIFIKKCSNRKL